MQIVFVHGVNVRDNVRDDDDERPTYKRSVDLRDGYFRAWLEPASDRKLRIYNRS